MAHIRIFGSNNSIVIERGEVMTNSILINHYRRVLHVTNYLNPEYLGQLRIVEDFPELLQKKFQ